MLREVYIELIHYYLISILLLYFIIIATFLILVYDAYQTERSCYYGNE